MMRPPHTTAITRAVIKHPEYAGRRAEVERTYAASFEAAGLFSQLQTEDAFEAMCNAQRAFMAAQARVTELYTEAMTPPREDQP